MEHSSLGVGIHPPIGFGEVGRWGLIEGGPRVSRRQASLHVFYGFFKGWRVDVGRGVAADAAGRGADGRLIGPLLPQRAL